MNQFSLQRISVKKLLILLAAFTLLFPTVTNAAPKGDPDPHGLKGTAVAAGLADEGANPGMAEIAGKILGAGLSLLGLVFLGLMIYGGFLWMVAKGDQTTVTKAKEIITHAVIGFAIVAGAYAITDFAVDTILGAATGTDVAPPVDAAP